MSAAASVKSKKRRKRKLRLQPKGNGRGIKKFDAQSWRQQWRDKSHLSVSKWNEAHIVLSSRSSPRPGPFTTSHTPYMRELMDDFGDSTVESITGCWAAQVGKTEAVKGMLAYAIAEDPGPALWVAPSMDMAKSFVETRFDVMVLDNKILRRLKPDDRHLYKIQEKHFAGMTLNFVGAASPANLASRPIRYLFMDEIDKYPLASEREAAAIDLAIHRTATYWNRKIVCISTPTLKTGAIYQRFLKGDQRYFWVPCVKCGHQQVLRMEGLRCADAAKDAAGDPIPDLVRETTRYLCEKCEYPHSENDKAAMLHDGVWVPSGNSKRHRSRQLSRLYSPFTSWGECLSEFLAARHDPGALMNVVQSIMGEPWEEPGLTIDEATILAHRLDYEEFTAPAEAFLLALTADIQEDRVYYIIRAYGRHATSYLVRYGIVERPEDLVTIARTSIAAGSERVAIQPENVWIDSGFRADEIYKLCAEHGFTPIKGADANMRPWEYPVVRSKTNRQLINIDTQRFKMDLLRQMEIAPGTAGSWNLFQKVDINYARHLTAEKAVKRKDRFGREVVEWIRRGPNHWFDCEVYAAALAFWRNVRDLAVPYESSVPPTTSWGIESSRGPGY